MYVDRDFKVYIYIYIYIYILVSKIHDNEDMVMGIHKVYKIGGMSTQDSGVHFLNRFIPVFPKTEKIQKPMEQRFIKTDVPS